MKYKIFKFIGVVSIVEKYSEWIRTEQWRDGKTKRDYIKGDHEEMVKTFLNIREDEAKNN